MMQPTVFLDRDGVLNRAIVRDGKPYAPASVDELAILPDAAHAQSERRFRAIGRTEKGRSVFIVFTLRHKGDETLIRPISARYMHKKEIEAYEKENPDL